MEEMTPARFEDGRPMFLAGVRRRHPFDETGEGLAAQWRELLAAEALPGRVGSSMYGVMCGADASGFEYLCGVEVESFAGLPPDAGKVRVPPQRYAVFAPEGPLRATWMRILDWLATGPYDSAHLPDFELYGPGADPLAESGPVEIWVGVVPRASS
ncbi:MAG TPA: effector binding domain-containing protein [Longimicrobium sp.]|nr:effector binding domain-containing protein [Longimicrobium sp.]